jgi:phage shock protein C
MSTAAAEFQADPSSPNVALPLRSDTFLGVCEAIGQDLGINPNWLRIAFAPFIIISPWLTIGVYLVLGAVVAASRWLYPREVPSAEAAAARDETNDVFEEKLAA